MTHFTWSALSRHARLRSQLASAPHHSFSTVATTVTPRTPRRPLRHFSTSLSVARDPLEPILTSTSHEAPDLDTDPYPLLSRTRPILRDATRPPSNYQSMSTSQFTPSSSQPISPPRRKFHNYFITHLPSSSMHPDRGTRTGPGHGLPRDASTPHTAESGHSPASSTVPGLANRELTVVRIPLRSAKHHFGTASSRGTRPYNEDADQAGTIDMPAFAKRAPMSLVRKSAQKQAEVTPADSSFGDPQIFYFAVFDGHGGNECSRFLKDELHGYIEEASAELGLRSSLGKKNRPGVPLSSTGVKPADEGKMIDQTVKMKSYDEAKAEMRAGETQRSTMGTAADHDAEHDRAIHGSDPVPARVRNRLEAAHKIKDLIDEYRDTIGGYFRRFIPAYLRIDNEDSGGGAEETAPQITVESVLEYAFLRADLDFVSAQARKPDPHDMTASDAPYNNDEILGIPHATPSGHHHIGGRNRFHGGSTASVALLSTPTPAPFWHPGSHATLMVAHVGDTRAILCDTSTGLAAPVTSDHHPNTPAEERRLRRYAPSASLVTGDSFGEQRITGLANSRSFGDMQSKRVGVSAEPEITRIDMTPAQYSFLVLCSDGVSGTLSDQEIVDVVKEAKTPHQAAQEVVDLATELSGNGDNATCLVVRLGGWERRSEGGVGSLGTKEVRDMRRAEASDPRRGKR